MGMTGPELEEFHPRRPVDASHPDLWLELNRCILCKLCVRASDEVDKKHVFSLAGRGINRHVVVNSESGKLVDTDISLNDKVMSVCPVGVILRKRHGFAVPIGRRRYDEKPISEHTVRAPRGQEV
jgi:[NiFe] hydrogenase diaphorase moiety small subunit